MSATNQPLDPNEENQPVDASGQDNVGQQQPASEDDLAVLLEQAQGQVAQYYDELLRAKAEVENVRRRAQEDVAKARKFGTESFAESLVPVRDSLEAALAAVDQTTDSWREGVEVTLRQLTAAFERNLLKEVAPEPGEKFDPNLHQAISTVPSEFAEGCVVMRLQKGYTIAERVLRPALVTVSSGQTA
ncbi:MAG TPA: nucleotide exchange factor GrpE [Pusillimonas sp.]|uniref:nucleotide exchange factor GrpE n=1 Tax=Pusillimonas sp. TaxID=3040095 RepID=UPI002B7D7B6D|nr:nucleotide exchange factor GrpE [Pusillimonas sp.]HUH87791.1 nucleotide exchange factor GrpE [Pusillimonas sp.]